VVVLHARLRDLLRLQSQEEYVVVLHASMQGIQGNKGCQIVHPVQCEVARSFRPPDK
jgi:hypothetical protein